MLADPTLQDYVFDCLGYEWVGYLMVVYSIVDAGSCLLSSRIACRVGRVPIVLAGSAVNAGLLIFFVMWPTVPSLAAGFLIAGLWGSADAVWNTQLNSKDAYQHCICMLYLHTYQPVLCQFKSNAQSSLSGRTEV